ncbi:hypothetical protein L6452_43491 [Arctium lappa]|uniref:Uncharacterized protein n=1 Tax=Arctium lappa TaxID=4217 RepID=A0ACB8XD36_ARCLA|nr:hypothetical protein L6452_43491 [Arctium lappa]
MVAEGEATKRHDALRSEERGESSRVDVTYDVSAPMHAAVNSTQEIQDTGTGDDSQLKDTRRSVFQRLNYASVVGNSVSGGASACKDPSACTSACKDPKVGIIVATGTDCMGEESGVHEKEGTGDENINMDDAQTTTTMPGDSILTAIDMEDLESPRVDESSMGNEHVSVKATRQRLDGECSRPLKQPEHNNPHISTPTRNQTLTVAAVAKALNGTKPICGILKTSNRFTILENGEGKASGVNSLNTVLP